MDQALGELSVLDVRSRWSTLRDDVASPMGIPADPVEIDPEEIREDTDSFRKLALVQALQDLGYLPEPTDESQADFTSSEIKTALNQWREDTLKSTIGYRLDPKKKNAQMKMNGNSLPADVLPLLTLQTSYDGLLQLCRMPKVTDKTPTLESRILLFRLKTFGRFSGSTGEVIKQSDLSALQSLSDDLDFKKAKGLLSFLNTLGNADKLINLFKADYQKQIFVVPEALPINLPASDLIVNDYKIDMVQLKIGFQANRPGSSVRPRGPKIPKLKYSKGSGKTPNFDTIRNTRINSFGLQLLQLRLWQAGYYHGAIDANWGNMSAEALDSFSKSFADQKIKKEEIYSRVQGGNVLNLFYAFKLLKKLVEEIDETETQVNINKLGDTILEESSDDELNTIQDRAHEELKNISKSHIATVKDVEIEGTQETAKIPLRRRFNFSLRGIFASISGWFRGAFENIKKWALKIKNAIISGLKSVLNVFRYVLRKIKSAIRVVTLAVQRFYYWISGTPFGTGNPKTLNFILTKWSIDFDTVNFASEGCSNALLVSHVNRVKYMNESLHFIIGLSLQVIKLIKPSPISWLSMAWGIYNKVKEWNEWKSNNNPFINPQSIGFVV